MNDEIEEKLKKEKNVSFVNKIVYNNKNYLKAIKMMKSGIEYIYYEVENGEIKEVGDKKLLTYFKENYEINEGSIYH